MRILFVLLSMAVATAFADADHLLLTEICVTPSAAEFMEIYNPTDATISLDNIHLADLYGDSSSVEDFYPQLAIGEVTEVSSDFICMFPTGYSIAPGEYVTIAFNGNSFVNQYGFAADFDVRGVGGGAIPMAFHEFGYSGPSAGLTNGDEVVTLFYFEDDVDSGGLCYDLDYAMWGDNLDRRVNKTAIVVSKAAYLNDTAPALQDAIASSGHGSTYSFQRVDYAEGTETLSGGNGLSGHDETSENLSVTWTTDVATPGGGFTALERETWGAIKATF